MNNKPGENLRKDKIEIKAKEEKQQDAIVVGKNFGFWFDNKGDNEYDEIYGKDF